MLTNALNAAVYLGQGLDDPDVPALVKQKLSRDALYALRFFPKGPQLAIETKVDVKVLMPRWKTR